MRYILFILLACSFAVAQRDVNIDPQPSPYIQLGQGSLLWAGSGSNGLNNNWIFSPLDPQQGLCIAVKNNDAAAHSVTVTVYQTLFQNVSSFTGAAASWNAVGTTGVVSGLASGSTAIVYAMTQAAARVNVQFTGGSGAGTADVSIVQTSSLTGCGSQVQTIAVTSGASAGPVAPGSSYTSPVKNPVVAGTVDSGGLVRNIRSDTTGGIQPASSNQTFFNSIGGTLNLFSGDTATQVGSLALPVAPVNADGAYPFWSPSDIMYAASAEFPASNNTSAFMAHTTSTNPGALADLLVMQVSNWAAWGRVTFSCSVACEIRINSISSLGTTCTAVTAVNLSLRNTFLPSNMSINTACTGGHPTIVKEVYDLFLTTNDPYTLDLTGFNSYAAAAGGLGFSNVAAIAAGVVTVSVEWVGQ